MNLVIYDGDTLFGVTALNCAQFGSLLHCHTTIILELAPGKTGTVTITVPAERLKSLGLDLLPTFEPGAVEVLVGPRAVRADLLVSTVHMQLG